MEINMEQAKGWLDKATKEAQEVINNPSKIDEILIQLEEKLKTVPAIGETLSDLPLMIAMVPWRFWPETAHPRRAVLSRTLCRRVG